MKDGGQKEIERRGRRGEEEEEEEREERGARGRVVGRDEERRGGK